MSKCIGCKKPLYFEMGTTTHTCKRGESKTISTATGKVFQRFTQSEKEEDNE